MEAKLFNYRLYMRYHLLARVVSTAPYQGNIHMVIQPAAPATGYDRRLNKYIGGIYVQLRWMDQHLEVHKMRSPWAVHKLRNSL